MLERQRKWSGFSVRQWTAVDEMKEKMARSLNNITQIEKNNTVGAMIGVHTRCSL